MSASLKSSTAIRDARSISTFSNSGLILTHRKINSWHYGYRGLNNKSNSLSTAPPLSSQLEAVIQINLSSDYTRAVILHSTRRVSEVTTSCHQQIVDDTPTGFSGYAQLANINSNIQYKSYPVSATTSSVECETESSLAD